MVRWKNIKIAGSGFISEGSYGKIKIDKNVSLLSKCEVGNIEYSDTVEI